MTTLLSLHIESAVDPGTADLTHSMTRISISQMMLLLTQGKEIPALKRALPIFEEILAKRNLYVLPPNDIGQVSSQTQSRLESISEAYGSPYPKIGVGSSRSEQREKSPIFDVDFLGVDFLYEWQNGELNFTAQA
jgi:hypothetical protein